MNVLKCLHSKIFVKSVLFGSCFHLSGTHLNPGGASRVRFNQRNTSYVLIGRELGVTISSCDWRFFLHIHIKQFDATKQELLGVMKNNWELLNLTRELLDLMDWECLECHGFINVTKQELNSQFVKYLSILASRFSISSLKALFFPT